MILYRIDDTNIEADVRNIVKCHLASGNTELWIESYGNPVNMLLCQSAFERGGHVVDQNFNFSPEWLSKHPSEVSEYGQHFYCEPLDLEDVILELANAVKDSNEFIGYEDPEDDESDDIHF